MKQRDLDSLMKAARAHAADCMAYLGDRQQFYVRRRRQRRARGSGTWAPPRAGAAPQSFALTLVSAEASSMLLSCFACRMADYLLHAERISAVEDAETALHDRHTVHLCSHGFRYFQRNDVARAHVEDLTKSHGNFGEIHHQID